MNSQALSHVQLFVTPWTVAHQDSLSKGFFRQEYWSELPFPLPGDFSNSGIEPISRVSSIGRWILTTETPGKSPVLIQFSSVAQLCLTLCEPMNCSTPGLPVHHQLPDFTQTYVHRVADAIQPSHPIFSFFFHFRKEAL